MSDENNGNGRVDFPVKGFLFVAPDAGIAELTDCSKLRPAYYVAPDGVLCRYARGYVQHTEEAFITPREIRALVGKPLTKDAVLDRCDVLFERAKRRGDAAMAEGQEYYRLCDLLVRAHLQVNQYLFLL